MTDKLKRVPMRTCIVTRQKLPKTELIRLVRTKEGDKYVVKVDLRNKLNGRGANLIPDVETLKIALAKGHLSRALQLGRSLNEEEQQNLITEFADALAEKEFRPKNQKVKFKISKQEYVEKLGE